METSIPDDPFGEAVQKLVEAVQGRLDPPPDALRTLHRGLETYVARHFDRALVDPGDVASEALVRLLEMVDQKRVEPSRAAGLVTVLARNTAVDVIRRQNREVIVEDPTANVSTHALADDEIAGLIDRTIDADAVQRAMKRAFWQGDFHTLRVVRTWLDLADELGHAPSAREAGEVLGVSHTTVLRALKEFRGYVPDRGSQTKSEQNKP